jgi:hypothetical protein
VEKRRSSGMRSVVAPWLMERRREVLREGVESGRWSLGVATAAASLTDRTEIDASDEEWGAFVEELADEIERASSGRIRASSAIDAAPASVGRYRT